MGSCIDLDFVVAGHPRAKKELAELRQRAEKAEAELEKLRSLPPVIGQEHYQNHGGLMRMVRAEPEWAGSRLREAERVRRELLAAQEAGNDES